MVPLQDPLSKRAPDTYAAVYVVASLAILTRIQFGSPPFKRPWHRATLHTTLYLARLGSPHPQLPTPPAAPLVSTPRDTQPGSGSPLNRAIGIGAGSIEGIWK